MKYARWLLVIAAASTPAATQPLQTEAGRGQPAPRQPNLGTAAELEDRATVETVQQAIRSGTSTNNERQIAQAFADCMVQRRPEQARTVIVDSLPSDELWRRFPNLVDDRCYNRATGSANVEMQFPFPATHMLLADALVRRDFAASGPDTVAASPPLVPLPWPSGPTERQRARMSAQERVEQQARDEGEPAWVVMQRLGECVARRAPEDVRRLALTSAASPEERAQIATLQPSLGACLPPGATIRLRAADVRGASLLAYYRLAQSPAITQATAAEVPS